MKAVVAAFLRGRSAWTLVAIAAVLTGVALGITYGTYTSTRRLLQPALVVLFGTAGAALFLAVVRRAEDIGRGGSAGKLWASFVAGVLAIAGAITFVTYSFGHFVTPMIAGCNVPRLERTLPARRAALAEAEARLKSPFALLPGLVDDRAARECQETRDDLARVDQGRCSKWTLTDQTCACGDESYPYHRCAEPTCLYAPGLPDRFDCVGDPIVPGYVY